MNARTPDKPASQLLAFIARLLQAAGLIDLSDLQRKLRGIFTVNPINSASMNWVMR